MLTTIFIILIVDFLFIFGSIKFYTQFLLFSIIGSIILSVFLFFYLHRKGSKRIKKVNLLSIIIGVLLSYLTVELLFKIISPFFNNYTKELSSYLLYTKTALYIFFTYLIAIELTYLKTPFISSSIKIPKGKKEFSESPGNYKILDTSVIIDGRIADISETGFLEGILIIPNFILLELQQIADSPDALKRQRGRRGLDILNKMKKGLKSIVEIIDDDFPEVHEVDEKLMLLAKKYNAAIVTNDFNLNKVAQIQGIKVLNINELANAVKPIVLPGEELSILITKEGKDSDQGIGYLEDGTMVVVENGHQYIGKKVDVVVTSVLQTTAGRMIFAK